MVSRSDMKIAIYARVSTRDKDQNPETQLLPLREFVKARGWEIHKEYVDYASALDMRGRREWRKLQKDARAGLFDMVVAQRLDRISRSVKDLWAGLTEWESLGISFMSLRESFDTGTPAGRLQMNIMAALAEFELDLIKERIQDGLDRARAEGKHLGRPEGRKDTKPRKKSGYKMRYLREARARGE